MRGSCRCRCRRRRCIRSRPGRPLRTRLGEHCWSRSGVLRRFGKPTKTDFTVVPVGQENAAGYPPVMYKVPGRPYPALRYGDVAFLMYRNTVTGVEISAAGAQTTRGVGVGSSLAAVRRAYRGARCGTVDIGETFPVAPYCFIRASRHTYVWFGDDPVANISISLRVFPT